MDIRRLEAFRKVYELGSFSKAGQDLFLSQPTISAHVSSLENELQVKLFDRLGRKVLPTQAGEVLYGHALGVFANLETAKAEIAQLKDEVTGTLNIGASTIPAHYILPRVMAEFRNVNSDVRMSLSVGDTENIVERVAMGKLDAGIVGDKLDEPDVAFERYISDQLVVIASKDFEVPVKKQIALNEITAWPWIMRERGSGTRASLERGLSELGLSIGDLNVVVSVESTQAAVSCVRAGLGVSVTSRLAAEPLISTGEMVEIDVPGLELARDFFIVHHEKRSLFPVTRHFIEFLNQSSQGLSAKCMNG